MIEVILWLVILSFLAMGMWATFIGLWQVALRVVQLAVQLAAQLVRRAK